MHTRVTEILGIDHPVLSAGMGTVTNFDLVAAVSDAGGLGILGATFLSPGEIRERVAELRRRTSRPFALNLLLAFCTTEQIEACLEARVPVLSTAWGMPDEAAARSRTAGIPLVHMVTTAEQAAAAARAGVSVIAAQGHEAGRGLVGPVGGMALIPAAVDAVRAARGPSGPPVVTAGGVADGRGLAAALALGAEGVLVGTRFLATDEAPVPAVWKTAICEAREDDTVYTRVANLVARPTWAAVAPSRVLRTHAIASWLNGNPSWLRSSGRSVTQSRQAGRGHETRGARRTRRSSPGRIVGSSMRCCLRRRSCAESWRRRKRSWASWPYTVATPPAVPEGPRIPPRSGGRS